MRYLLLILVLVVQTSAGGCGPSISEEYREAGRRAHRAGVPAQANPHIGDGRIDASQTWLEGWMEEAEKAKADK